MLVENKFKGSKIFYLNVGNELEKKFRLFLVFCVWRILVEFIFDLLLLFWFIEFILNIWVVESWSKIVEFYNICSWIDVEGR